jgi:hypothetical protein
VVISSRSPKRSDVPEPAEQHRLGVLLGGEHLLPHRLVEPIVD